MGKQLDYIHNSLEHKHILPTKGLEIVNWLISKDKGHAYYIEIQEFRGYRLIPKLTRSNLNNQQLNLLHNDLLKTPPINKGTLTLNGEQFLRYSFIGSHFKIEFVKASSSKQLMMTMVARRLIILSAIILWLAIWFALAMSTLIAKRVQEKNDQLTHIATHDALTGLPNRLFLKQTLEQSLIYSSSINKVSEGCLMIIDLDKFKEVNDSFGHTAGDLLLKDVAKRLKLALKNNQLVVRVGGDEFVIWAPNASIEEAQHIAKNLVSVCDEPVMINNLAVNIGASIGIAHYPSQANTIELLMVCADTAMYQAKQHHQGWHLFDQVNNIDHKNRLSLRADLNAALSEKQIKLYYQPKINLQNYKTIGLEALARWHHPIKGLLTPDHFIELIEQSGRVQEFGRYIITSAIEQLAAWKKVDILIPIAVNLSPHNLLDPGLVEFISDTLEEHKIKPQLLEIELTENETSLNIELIKNSINAINKIGVVMAIDDFGTGMSSLSYIANLNVNSIKIDRAFVIDILTNEKHKAIVSATITLAQSLGAKMVAEGIENQEQLDLLISMGCHYGQGYLFSKPQTADNTILSIGSTKRHFS
jgi:diguanylate cyclase (GGDEF)-like protein